MTVEYWNEMKQQWLPSGLSWEDAQRVNEIASREMYRKVE